MKTGLDLDKFLYVFILYPYKFCDINAWIRITKIHKVT